MVRGPVSMVIIMVITLFMFGLVALGPRAFSGILPESVSLYIETLGDPQMMADRGYVSRGKGAATAGEYLYDGERGWEATGPIAAYPGDFPVFIDEVMAGYQGRLMGQAPASVTVLPPLAGCAPTPPSADARLAHAGPVSVEYRALDLWSYTDRDLADGVRSFVENHRRGGKKWKPAQTDQIEFNTYDIAVTEVERPVYLVVVSTNADSRWMVNIALAPGATLERVVLLGGAEMGVVNLPEGVPVEVMRAPELSACGATPRHALNPGHRFYAEIDAGRVDPTKNLEAIAKIDRESAAWDRQFKAWFGVGAADTLAGGWQAGTVSVAGPIPLEPEQRAIWKPVDGGQAQITAAQYIETPQMAKEGKGFADRVKAIAAAFAWGDVKNLDWRGDR